MKFQFMTEQNQRAIVITLETGRSSAYDRAPSRIQLDHRRTNAGCVREECVCRELAAGRVLALRRTH